VLLHKLREAMGATIRLRVGRHRRGRWVRILAGTRCRRTARQIAPTGAASKTRAAWLLSSLASGRAGRGRGLSGAGPMACTRSAVASGTEVHADEAPGWNILHASYPMKRVNHSVEYDAARPRRAAPSCASQRAAFLCRSRAGERPLVYLRPASGSVYSAGALALYASNYPPKLDNRYLGVAVN
jgi:hypothetical protein